MSDAPTPDKPLEKLGKYELRGVLGKGAMGVVYDGWDPMIQRRVAIKTARLPDPDDVEAQEELGRFRREAQAAGRLSHPNIVGVYDSGETDGVAYFVMELVEGQSLKDMLAREQRMAPGDAVAVMEEVLAGLHYSHARGVIHRDIKPANVMMTNAGQAKIADFGIARIESSSLTQAGTMMGTPAYMSPEQFMGQTVDSRTDIYSAGVMLYQLLTGDRPFEGSITAIMHKALNTVPPRPSELSVTVKPALDAVVARAMARRPEDRFATAAEFAAALRTAYEAPESFPAPRPSFSLDDDATMVAPSVRDPSRAAPPPPPPSAPVPAKPKSKAPLVVAGVLAVLALGGGGAYLALSGGSAPLPPVADRRPEPPKPVVEPDAPAREAAVEEARPAEPPTADVGKPPAQTQPDQQAAVLPTLRTPPPQDASGSPAVLAAVSSAIKDVPCSLTEAAMGPDGLHVTGIVGPSPGAGVTTSAKAAAGGEPVHVQVRPVKPAYCSALNLLRSVADGPAMSLSLKGGDRQLHDQAEIIPTVALPDGAPYLRLDYLSGNGKVTHVYPTAPEEDRQPVAGRTMSPLIGKVGPPYGTDLIIAIASSQPLNLGTHPQTEPIGPYVTALQAAAAAVRAGRGAVAGRAVVLDTIP